MKKLMKEEEREEKRRASFLIRKHGVDELFAIRKKILDELRNIQEMEEKFRAKEILSKIKRGEDTEKLFEEYKEMVDLSPPSNENIEVIEVHPVTKPFSYVRILYDSENHEHIYEVLEPTLSMEERKLLDFLKDTLIKTMDIELTEFNEDEAREYLRKNVDRILKDYGVAVDDITHEKIMYYIIRDFLGYGKIDVLMRDPMIEDISCDAAGVPIFIYHRNYESIKTNVMFHDDAELDSFVIQLAQNCGRHI